MDLVGDRAEGARQGQADEARLLLESAADPGARDERDWTPMHWAAFGYPIHERSARGAVSFEIATLLLLHGAERCPVDAIRKTPLDLLDGARSWSKPALADLLRGRHE